MGVGQSLGLYSGVIACNKWFPENTALASGFANSGAGVGPFAIPFLWAALKRETNGWRGALAALGAMVFAVLFAGALGGHAVRRRNEDRAFPYLAGQYYAAHLASALCASVLALLDRRARHASLALLLAPSRYVNWALQTREAVAAAKKSGASKDEIQAKVDKLLALKKQITALDPNHALAIVDKKKKAKAPEPAGEKKGLSKREQKRLARGEDVKKKKKDKNHKAKKIFPYRKKCRNRVRTRLILKS